MSQFVIQQILSKIITSVKKNPNLVINGFTEIKDKKMFNSPHMFKMIFKKTET